MALKLPSEMNEFYGRNADTMPKLLQTDNTPMSTSRLMQLRLEHGETFPDLWNNYFDTSDLVVYPKGNNQNIYVLLTTNNKNEITQNGRKALELIRPDNLASNNSAIVEKLNDVGRKGRIQLSKNDITIEQYLTQDQVAQEQLWRVLARHPDEVPKEFAEDKNLLNDYNKKVATRTKQSENMALYLGSSLDDTTTLRAWCVLELYDGSDASGWNDLDNDSGRFVGLASETQTSPGNENSQLEERISSALSDARPFEHKGTIYVPTTDKHIKLEN